jgi:hypothetical protein
MANVSFGSISSVSGPDHPNRKTDARYRSIDACKRTISKSSKPVTEFFLSNVRFRNAAQLG